jgi:hypothetical protein
MELSTERNNGMGVGSIPVSKIWQYIDRFDLPDWYEPVLLQADAAFVSGLNKEQKSASRSAEHKNNKSEHQGSGAIRSG